MCDLATAATIASIAGAGLSAVSTYQQGKAQAAQYDYQAQINKNNAILSERAAKDAEARGTLAEKQQRLQTEQLKGQQRVAYGASGIDLSSDVVGSTLTDTAALGELDALTIRDNAAREAYGYRIEGMNYNASAANNSLAAKSANSGAVTGAAGSLLGGVGTVANQYYSFKSSGAYSKNSPFSRTGRA